MNSLEDRLFQLTCQVAAGLVMFTTVSAVAIHQSRHRHTQPVVEESGRLLQSRALRFVDLADGVAVYGGHVRVFDAVTGEELPPLRDSDGFVRAVLNSLSFERRKVGVAGEPVFDLASWSDYRLTLTDKATGARVSLGQFGAGNKAVFYRFLPPAKTE